MNLMVLPRKQATHMLDIKTKIIVQTFLVIHDCIYAHVATKQNDT